MKKSILFLTGAAILLAGCAKVQNEEVLPEPEKTTQTVTLTASIGDNTRVSADAAGNYAWQVGEKIAVHVTGPEEDRIIPFTSTATEPTTTTNFTGEMSASEHLGQYAFYPVGGTDGGHSVDPDGVVLFGLWGEYMYVKDATNMPMLGTITSNGASFKAVGGLLKVIVYNVPEGTDQLVFTVNDENALITGGFLVTDDGEITLESHDYGGSNSILFNLWEEDENGDYDHSLWEQNMVFYIPLPVGTYHSFSFNFWDICDENGTEIANPTTVTKNASMGGSGLQVNRNDIIVAPALNLAPPATTVTLWSEDFSSFNKDDVPGTNNKNGVGYGNTTVYYSVTNGGGTTKVYAESNTSGESPELLVAKSNGSFTATGIPTAGATNATLSFLSNRNTLNISSSTEGVTISKLNDYSYKLSIAASITSFDLTFTNTGSNARLDNILLVATVGASVTTPVILSDSESATIAADKLSASINGIRITNPLDGQGIVATTDAEWLNLAFEGSQGFEVGKKLVATATDHNYDAEERTATVTLTATGATKTVTIKQTSSLVSNPTLISVAGDATFTVTWTGHDKADSYIGYYSENELSDPTTGTPLTITYDGDDFTATPSSAVVNGQSYHVYVKVASLIESASAYRIADGWASIEVTPTAVIDYRTKYTSDNVTLSAGTNASPAYVVINGTSYEAIKAGTSSGTGSNVIKVTIPANTSIVHLHIAGWSGDGASVSLSIGGGVTISPSSFNPKEDSGISGSGNSFTIQDEEPSSFYKKITISPAAGIEKELTISSTGKKNRFVIWGVNAE